MADLVRVLVNGQETNVSRAWAKKRKLNVLEDEPTHRGDGTVRRTTRKGGRPLKPKKVLPSAGSGSSADAALSGDSGASDESGSEFTFGLQPGSQDGAADGADA